MAAGWRDFLTAWDGFRIKGVEYREIDNERVLVLTRQGGRGKASGLDLGQMQGKGGAALFHFRGEKVAGSSSTGSATVRSPTWGCRSKTLTPTPEPAGYCAGDVAGERGDRAVDLDAWGRGDFELGRVGSDPEIESVIVAGPAPRPWTGLSRHGGGAGVSSLRCLGRVSQRASTEIPRSWTVTACLPSPDRGHGRTAAWTRGDPVEGARTCPLP